MVEARWRQLVVSSDDAAADEQIAEAIARVVARYAVDLRSGVQVTMRHDGANVTYVGGAAINLASAVRAARTQPVPACSLSAPKCAAAPTRSWCSPAASGLHRAQ
jgi:hypothetical protein